MFSIGGFIPSSLKNDAREGTNSGDVISLATGKIIYRGIPGI